MRRYPLEGWPAGPIGVGYSIAASRGGAEGPLAPPRLLNCKADPPPGETMS